MRTAARAAAGMAPVPSAPKVPAPSSSVPSRVGPARSGGMFNKHWSGDVAGQGDLGIPTFLPHPGQTKVDRVTRKRSASTPSPLASMGSIAPKPVNLSGCIGRVDWTGNLEALRQGVLRGNVPSDVLTQLEAAATLGAVQDLAAALGVTVEAVAVALLARADELSSRSAARLARAVLSAADKPMLEAAARAVGL